MKRGIAAGRTVLAGPLFPFFAIIICLLLPFPARAAGIQDSYHNFSSLPFAARGSCSGCHVAHNSPVNTMQWPSNYMLWPRNVWEPDGEWTYFSQRSNPNYVPKHTILCYDCHSTQSVPNDRPPWSDWASEKYPKDIAFTDGAGNKVGYYDADGGHFWKEDVGGIDVNYKAGDKIYCTLCHDPHDRAEGMTTKNEVMLRRYIYSPVGTNPVDIGDNLQATPRQFPNNDPYPDGARYGTGDGREMCITCHGASDPTGHDPKIMWGITLPKPPDNLPPHRYADNTYCTTCHKHNKITARCTDCHGLPPDSLASAVQPSSPGYFESGGIDEGRGPHPLHAKEVVDGGYGISCYTPLSGSPVGACHPTLATATHNQPDLLRSFQTVVFGADRNPGNTTAGLLPTYTAGTRTCNNLYCHSRGTAIDDVWRADNDPGTDDPVVAIAWTGSVADDWSGKEIGCDSCHGDGTGTARAGYNRGPGDPVAATYGAPAYTSGSPKSNNHPKHRYACNVCHYTVLGEDGDPSNGWTIAGRSQHVDNTATAFSYDIAPNPGNPRFAAYDYNATGRNATLGGICTLVTCHGSGAAYTSATWGQTFTCVDCHGSTTADTSSWSGNDGVMSQINTTQYNAAETGHGMPTATVTCDTCHDSTVPHDLSASLGGANPFRLRGYGTTVTTPEAFCLQSSLNGVNCHTGIDPAHFPENHVPANMTNPKRTWPGTVPKCWDCHDPHGDRADGAAADNLGMIHQDIFHQGSGTHGVPITPTSSKSVKFTLRGGLDTVTDNGSYANTLSGNARGVCQVCHTALSPDPILSFKAGDTSPLQGNHPTSGLDPCTACHPHDEGLEGSACEACHNGSYPPAPDIVQGELGVSSVWDGTWWDSTQMGGPYQQGGHGDADGKLAIMCQECHDIAIPIDGSTGKTTHLNGTLESVELGQAVNVNPAHLRQDPTVDAANRNFIPDPAANDWSVQVQADITCGGTKARGLTDYSCHKINSVKFMTHANRNDNPAPGVCQFSVLHLTVPDGNSLPAGYPTDRDLSDNGSSNNRFVLCVSCHNPHGTKVLDVKGDTALRSNYMLRLDWSRKSDLCKICHN